MWYLPLRALLNSYVVFVDLYLVIVIGLQFIGSSLMNHMLFYCPYLMFV
jgi:hypothetical protein